VLKQLLKNLGRQSATVTQDRTSEAAGDAELERAVTSYRRGDLAAAEKICSAILTDDPGNDGAHNLLGAIALDRGNMAVAITHFERAISLDPGKEDYYSNCGEAYRRAGGFRKAIAYCETALRIKPGYHAAWLNLAHAQGKLGKVHEAVIAFRKALALHPDAKIHSTLLLILNGCPGIAAEEVLAEHRRWGDLYANHLGRLAPIYRAQADPEKVLRVGYVAGKFTSCFTESIIASRDRRNFLVFFYNNHDGASMDDDARCLRALADEWRQIENLSDLEAVELIRRDEIDILVDLAGHSRGYRLLTFAYKPAPVQVTYLGYLNTSGMRSIDYRITDAYADPPGIADTYHVERLLRLPHSQWCYRPPAEMPVQNPLPAQANGYVTFGSFNNFHKVNDEVRKLWAGLLIEVPDSKLLIIGVPKGECTEELRGDFARQGVSPDRLMIRRQLTYPQYLRTYHEADIALDPFPFNGGTTTCESLWMGLPVITLAGQYGPARSGVSLLSAVGLGELIAETPAGYIAIAKRLSADVRHLNALRTTLRERMRNSPLMDAVAFTRSLETVYRDIWQDWCAKQSAPS
jgi:protein O-GlcNAc transferase